jgi:peptidoglycan biosynthesis protein MviN/MurJ (putative lipid II flippase)
VGLAAATSVGAWFNLSLLAFFARRQGFAVSGAAIGKPVLKLLVAGALLTASLIAGYYGLQRALAHLTYFRDETTLGILFVLGAVVYTVAILLLLGVPWLKSLLREVTTVAEKDEPAMLEPSDPTDDSAVLPDSDPPPKG